MTFRSQVAYGSYTAMSLVMIVSAVIGRRRRRDGIVVMQITALMAVAALAALWEPYVPLH